MKKIYLTILCLSFVACDPKVTVNTPDVAVAAKNLESGLSKFDAIGLKKLLDENKDLRDTVDKLRALVNTVPTGSGVIVAEGRDLQFSISQYSGSFKVTAWINDEENWFWQNRVFPRKDFSLGFDFNTVFNASIPTNIPGNFRKAFLEGDPDIKKSRVNELANSGAENKFQEFLKKTTTIPRAGSATVDLNSQLGAGNLHRLFVAVTPTEGDKNGQWSLRGTLTLKRGDKIEVLKEFDLGSDITPPHPVGKGLETVNILLMVKQN